MLGPLVDAVSLLCVDNFYCTSMEVLLLGLRSGMKGEKNDRRKDLTNSSARKFLTESSH
jgi:hypothetical protein